MGGRIGFLAIYNGFQYLHQEKLSDGGKKLGKTLFFTCQMLVKISDYLNFYDLKKFGVDVSYEV